MLELICKRLLLAIPTLLLVSMMVFGLQKLLPGDPLIAMAGEERDPAVIAQLRAELNLDAPLPVQYYDWLTRALQGDLGVSLRTHEPVTTLSASKLPVTLELSHTSALPLITSVPRFETLMPLPTSLNLSLVAASFSYCSLTRTSVLLITSSVSFESFWRSVIIS